MELILLPTTIISNSSEQILCFNPCFIGTYSFTKNKYKEGKKWISVLILVLLELILLQVMKVELPTEEKRFNPCFIGTYSFTHYLRR